MMTRPPLTTRSDTLCPYTTLVRSGLVDGARVSKAYPLMAAGGTGEEANAVLGLALLDIESDGHRAMVSRIQNELFDLGADLATPYVAGEAEGAALRITPAPSTRLETEIDPKSGD